MKKRPNILILMSDEHRYDVVGFQGNKIIRTPFLDQLASEGVIFDNAYTPSPVCIPARQCIAAGQFPRTCKVEHFGEDLPPQYNTFARVLAQNGYNTVAAGKLHHTGVDQMQGWLQRIIGDCHVNRKHYLDSGKEEINNVFSKGLKWTDEKEILRAGPGCSIYGRVDKLTVEATKDFIYQYFIDSYYDRATPEEPIMLYVGLNNPHYPYIAEEELFNYYLNRVELYENTQPFEDEFLGRCSTCGPLVPGENISIRDIKRAMAAYYANVETIDRQFAEVVKTLEAAGQNLDEWIIIYTTDHGEMLGEHGIWEKQKFFEGSVKVPFVIRYPKAYNHKIIKENVNLVDLFATLCDLAEIDIPQGLESRSLIPLMQGNNTNWIDETVSQWGGTNLMIKWGSIKYQWYEKNCSEIVFDLEVEPTESSNLIHEEKYQELLPLFRKRKKELGF